MKLAPKLAPQRHFLPLLAAALAGAILTVSPARAASVVLDIQGPLGGGVLLGDGNAFVASAATFTPRIDIFDAALGMMIYCDDCTGEVWLVSAPPAPDLPGARRVSFVPFIGPAGRTTHFDLTGAISGIALEAGTTYSLILEILSGDGFWHASPDPSHDGTFVTPGESLVSRPDRTSFPARLPFVTMESLGYSPLLYTISGTLPPAPVPLPASLPMALLGLGALGWLRRRHPRA